jgi:hypothetical protein
MQQPAGKNGIEQFHKIDGDVGKALLASGEAKEYFSDPKLFWHGSRLGSLDPEVWIKVQKHVAYKKVVNNL